MILSQSFIKKTIKDFFNKHSRMIDEGDLHEEFSKTPVTGDRVLREDDLSMLSSFLASKINDELLETIGKSPLSDNMLLTKNMLSMTTSARSEALSRIFLLISEMVVTPVREG